MSASEVNFRLPPGIVLCLPGFGSRSLLASASWRAGVSSSQHAAGSEAASCVAGGTIRVRRHGDAVTGAGNEVGLAVEAQPANGSCQRQRF